MSKEARECGAGAPFGQLTCGLPAGHQGVHYGARPGLGASWTPANDWTSLTPLEQIEEFLSSDVSRLDAINKVRELRGSTPLSAEDVYGKGWGEPLYVREERECPSCKRIQEGLSGLGFMQDSRKTMERLTEYPHPPL